MSMAKADATEANGIVQRLLVNLLGAIKDKGQAGIAAKSAIGWTSANALTLLTYGYIGTPLDSCFDQTRQAGASLASMENIRILISVETPKTLGATIVRDQSVLLCLAQQGKIISGMQFTSRQDVDALIQAIQDPFSAAQETVADTMAGADYIALVQLQAAIVNFLVSAQRPLPSMLSYQFFAPLPSLVISHKLYGDASRYDQIRDENKVVHPAFCPMIGRALSQ